ncbi:hypothetical protein B0H16DRAFT_1365093, partial [Mycena metata]
MSKDIQTSAPTSILGVATSGIQDISALLPLLGTDQCEKHISGALDRGLSYVAATPLSIFGSLGIVKAGFTTLWASVDISIFHGPQQMRNAGVQPVGMIKQITHISEAEDSAHVAEARLRTILD